MNNSGIEGIGAVYTPTDLAEWLAAELFAAAKSSNTQLRSVVDPACGNGELLRAVVNMAPNRVELAGIDIDPKAIGQPIASLKAILNAKVGDALDPNVSWGDSFFDAAIMNPPWGSQQSRDPTRHRALGYELASGQYDAFDLFVERAITELQPGALLGLILPETVFQPEHQALRRLMLQHTLVLVARLGEGIFPRVNCGTSVFVIRIGSPNGNHLVQCLQIPAAQRKRVKRGLVTFAQIKQQNLHHVPQSSFASNAGAEFDINRKLIDSDVIAKFGAVPRFSWKKWVLLGRGVEIGKRGSTVRCKTCGFHRPVPIKSTYVQCAQCGETIPADSKLIEIVSNEPGSGDWRRLIVGEDVDRYSAEPSRWIRWEVSGIRYKPLRHFLADKLLIRKTGLGLRSAVDTGGSAILQTVFYAIVLNAEDVWVLDYLQGVINSRPMLAWYLKWSGEIQWRSHPYVTPRALMSLPIPDPVADAETFGWASRIADEAKRIRISDNGSEYQIDDLVFRLFGFSNADVDWAKDVLKHTEGHLEYFARMNRWSVPQGGSHLIEFAP